MKKLALVRHAKSSWEFNLPDDKRPLKKRGINDAHLVSNFLANNFSAPDLILTSYAERAHQTAKLFIENLNLAKVDFQINTNLYDFSGNNLLETIKSTKNTVTNLLLFGHNNAITNFVNTYGNTYIENVPTCGFVEIHFKTDSWNTITKGNTIKTIFPKDLKA